tara:strand:- start:65 stop:319 length:255 start_codon:yes stop_codon:yes gene_type:complete
MSGDYFSHVERKYDEIIMRQSAAWKAIDLLTAKIDALETRLNDSKFMMRRSEKHEYERLVDVVCDHDRCITELRENAVSEDVNW